ncbi:hypothetical protein GJ496_007871 [Pomphorhynchus laevis]|nr:hypothetical protein GJ496_007871 [Pomphorhynchus laevis]
MWSLHKFTDLIKEGTCLQNKLRLQKDQKLPDGMLSKKLFSSRMKGEGLKSLQQTYAAQIAKTRKDAFTLRLNQALRFVPEITKRALEYAKYPGSSNWLTAGASEELHHHLSASEFRDGIATRYGFEPPDMPALSYIQPPLGCPVLSQSAVQDTVDWPSVVSKMVTDSGIADNRSTCMEVLAGNAIVFPKSCVSCNAKRAESPQMYLM